MLRDLVGREVGVALRRLVGVRLRHARGVAAERAVGEQVAAGADRAELAGPLDAVELAPVADALDAVVQRQQRAEVVLTADVRAAALVDAADAERGRPVERRRLGGTALGGADGGVRGAAHDVVGLLPHEAVADEAGRGPRLRRRRQQRARGDGAVDVGTGQVDDAAVGRPVELGGRRRTALRPGRVVPAGAEQHPAAQRPRGRGDPVEGDRERRRAGEVEPGEREPGGRRVDVRVDEGRSHPRVVEVDDAVGRERVGGALAADPHHLVAVDEQGGREGVGRGAHAAAAVQRRRHARQRRQGLRQSAGQPRTCGR